MSEQEIKTDLSLVPIETLLSEVRSRCKTIIYAYDLPDDTIAYNINHAGEFQDQVFLSTMLNHKIIQSGFEDTE